MAQSAGSSRAANFNPRLREGGDKSSFSHDIRRETFQSTPPRGRRRTGHPFPSRTGDFNPRLREGGDQCDILINRLSCELFQSTPPRGRRRISVPCSSQILFISIHASAREATLHSSQYLLHSQHFNPRLREGGDRIDY